MSTRILQDGEITQAGDIYFDWSMYLWSDGMGSVIRTGGRPVHPDTIVLREVNASCRCLSEDEILQAGDIAITATGQEIVIRWVPPETIWPYFGNWCGKSGEFSIDDFQENFLRYAIVAVVRYE